MMQTRFHILRSLNRGAYGQLYAAEDAETGKKVVVKVIEKLEEEDRGLIAREIKANAMMKGTKGICTLHAYIDEGRQTSLVFDVVHGADLFTVLQRRDFQPLEEKMVWKIVNQVAEALFACHQKGIAHRDVKLENVRHTDDASIQPLNPYQIMMERDRVFLIDFGLCTFFKVTDGKESLSSDYCGSPEYISPEHFKQTPLRATQVDAWALGITTYALLFGVFPYGLDEMPTTFTSCSTIPLPPDTEDLIVSRGMRDRLTRLLTIDPTKRSSVKIMMDLPLHRSSI
ncbi:hypothetical protein PROFUN_07184 [Planoprotostelium fungivorum]|uniref:Protein kinase domain-containing protein n=1 Tax=Planoprotostelium fungivorum TaxID=1890364 RepID=A0A2P6NMD9_9EUKA|nr:hypothetical protein PROFUN_07184 [Planoprotostelium fungivorum]